MARTIPTPPQPPVWSRFSPDREVATNILSGQIKNRLAQEGVKAGNFTISWMPSQSGSPDQVALIKFSGKNLHLSFDLSLNKKVDAIEEAVTAFKEHIKGEEIALQYVGSAWHSCRDLLPHINGRPIMAHHHGNGNRRYRIYANVLTHGLRETVKEYSLPLGQRQPDKELQRAIEEQAKLRQILSKAGTREKALTCCPVAAHIIKDGPEKMIATYRSNLAHALQNGTTTFKNGHYAPNIKLDGRVSWRDGKIRIWLIDMPLTIQATLDTLSYGEMIEHPWLPEGEIVGRRRLKVDYEIEIAHQRVPLIELLPYVGLTIDQII